MDLRDDRYARDEVDRIARLIQAETLLADLRSNNRRIAELIERHERRGRRQELRSFASVCTLGIFLGWLLTRLLAGC